MMAGEKKQKRIDRIDGRTVLFLTLCACIVTFLTTSFLGHGCFRAIPHRKVGAILPEVI